MWESLPIELKKQIWEYLRKGRCMGICLGLLREISREWKIYPFFCKGIPVVTQLCLPRHRRKEEPDCIRGPTCGKVDMSIPMMETLTCMGYVIKRLAIRDMRSLFVVGFLGLRKVHINPFLVYHTTSHRPKRELLTTRRRVLRSIEVRARITDSGNIPRN